MKVKKKNEHLAGGRKEEGRSAPYCTSRQAELKHCAKSPPSYAAQAGNCDWSLEWRASDIRLLTPSTQERSQVLEEYSLRHVLNYKGQGLKDTEQSRPIAIYNSRWSNILKRHNLERKIWEGDQKEQGRQYTNTTTPPQPPDPGSRVDRYGLGRSAALILTLFLSQLGMTKQDRIGRFIMKRM